MSVEQYVNFEYFSLCVFERYRETDNRKAELDDTQSEYE